MIMSDPSTHPVYRPKRGGNKYVSAFREIINHHRYHHHMMIIIAIILIIIII